MERTTQFDVIAQQREPEPRIELIEREGGAKLAIEAAALIGQYRFSSGDTLLVLDEDNPYEEQLHLALIRDAQIIDHLVIGAPYTSGIYGELALDNDALCFSFAGDTVFTLRQVTSLTESLPRGVRRRGPWFAPKHLSLTAQKGR